MGSKGIVLFFSVVMACCLAGCYSTPVRHLASDVALLKIGKSTKEDVTIYLGDPDEQQDLGNGKEKWLYNDVNTTLLEGMPFLGKYVGSPEYKHVVVTFQDGIVTDCTYTSSDDDDLGWSRDYSWQENNK